MQFHAKHLNIVRYCAEEIVRQQDGPLEVWYLIGVWNQAMERRDSLKAMQVEPHEALTLAIVKDWGFQALPHKNARGWRTVNLEWGQTGEPIGVQYQGVERAMAQWCEAVQEARLLPAEAYKEFELIHPFVDGNGRTGKLIYNWLLDSLDDPQMPPDFFGGHP